MLKKCLISALLIVLWVSGCSVFNDSSRQALNPGQHRASMTRQVALNIDYLLYLPDDYYSAEQKWPLIIFLHGVGERGSDLERVKAEGLPKLLDEGKSLPFIIASPQCPSHTWWPAIVEQIMALIDELSETYHVDENRIYLTGLSMGGFGTWSISCTYPERFAAVVPICGGGMPFLAHNLKDIPVWAFHGAEDSIVPLQRSQEMADAVKQVGGNVMLTVYPDTGHDSWTQTYLNDELYEWLLSHSKTAK